MVLSSTESPQPGQHFARSLMRAIPAWLVSLIVHLALLTAVAMWARSPSPAEPKDDVEGEYVIRLAAASEDSVSKLDFDSQKDANANPTASFTPESLADNSAKQLDQAFEQSLDHASELLGALPPATLPSIDLTTDVTVPKPELPRLPVRPAETDFFGSSAKGTRFVYVIDRSASMRFALDLAKRELLRSLDRLPPTAKFQIVCYDLEPHSFSLEGNRRLVQATRENKRRAAAFVQQFRSEGGTDHVRALKHALVFAPDVIYFLTDADELQPGQVDELTRLNARGSQAKIHCIELSVANRSRRDNPMRLLAQRTGGSYRGVDVRLVQPGR